MQDTPADVPVPVPLCPRPPGKTDPPRPVELTYEQARAPTTAAPGSPEKLAVLIARRHFGLPLSRDGDALGTSITNAFGSARRPSRVTAA
jgi:hypothetical protein